MAGCCNLKCDIFKDVQDAMSLGSLRLPEEVRRQLPGKVAIKLRLDNCLRPREQPTDRLHKISWYQCIKYYSLYALATRKSLF